MVRKGTGGLGVAPGELMQAIHGGDVYRDFDFRSYPCELTGWGGESPAFAELVRQVRPRLILEVGTWKGASAVSMAKAATSEGLPTKILCIDTWLGALEFRMDHNDPERHHDDRGPDHWPTVRSDAAKRSTLVLARIPLAIFGRPDRAAGANPADPATPPPATRSVSATNWDGLTIITEDPDTFRRLGRGLERTEAIGMGATI